MNSYDKNVSTNTRFFFTHDYNVISQNVHFTFHTFTLSTSCKDYTNLRAPSSVSGYLLLRHLL